MSTDVFFRGERKCDKGKIKRGKGKKDVQVNID
jgi:hypothetical protein